MKKILVDSTPEKLSKLNDIYNFQDTIILCKLYENRSKESTKKFLYNPRKCTLACSLGSCVQQYFSKVIIALPTQAKIVEVFEQNLIGMG